MSTTISPTDGQILAQRDAALTYAATEWAAQSYVAALAGMGVRDNGHRMPASWAVAECPWSGATASDGASLACTRPGGCQCAPDTEPDPIVNPIIPRYADHADAMAAVAAIPTGTSVRFAYPRAGDPAQGWVTVRGRVIGTDGESVRVTVTEHGEDAWLVGQSQHWSARFVEIDTPPTVEVNRTTYTPTEDGNRDVLGESTTAETFDPEYDRDDYGTPVAWAVATLRRLAEGFEPSVYPIPDELPERAWLSGTYDHPLYDQCEDMAAYVYGFTPRERAGIFRMVARPIAAQRAWHEQVLAAVTYGGPVAATYAAA